MNSHNRVQGVGLESKTDLVGTEPGTGSIHDENEEFFCGGDVGRTGNSSFSGLK